MKTITHPTYKEVLGFDLINCMQMSFCINVLMSTSLGRLKCDHSVFILSFGKGQANFFLLCFGNVKAEGTGDT